MFTTLKQRLFRTCSKTGRIIGVKFEKNWFTVITFPLLGILATIWILLRVIPKPSRLTYPCMKVAIPISSSFVIFISGLILSVFSVRKLKNNKRYPIIVTGILSLLVIAGIFLINTGSSQLSYGNIKTINQSANMPIGIAKGIYPGRVVWVHNPDATNENCTMLHNDDGTANEDDDGWFLNKNNNQNVIDEMLNKAVMEISGKIDMVSAWNEIFKYYNSANDKGDIGYQDGEKIFIKINTTSTWGMDFNWGNIKSDFSVNENGYYGISETSPHLILSLLNHLVDHVGIEQENIYVGDPMKHIYKHMLDLWKSDFPNVHYLDYDRTDDGREIVVPSTTAKIEYSDRGAILREGSTSDATVGDSIFDDYLYTIFEEMDYMINVPTLKGHDLAGITISAKNHFGSQTRENAKHLHGGLVSPEIGSFRRTGYGLYRVQVDIMGHKLLGEKNLIYLVDALWSAGMEVTQPSKWQIYPFNNDWSSSIFISQDPVAIESVGYDFLRTEYTEDKHPGEAHAQMEGADDYLHQSADSANWPDGIVYDPDNDGIPISSLGTHEHWNNAKDMEYSVNLGLGHGIELKRMDTTNDTQDDTVIVHHVINLPEFDGIDTDECWQNLDWQEIGQTWMPFGDFVLSDDFSGRYKCLWNYNENVLCFLVEIKDDTLVDGYISGETGYPNYDVLEVFIDEDNSGGMHRIDSGSENAENAFSYHMNINFPEIGETTTSLIAMDIAGFWQRPDYADHFSHFCLKRYNHKNVYEFSIKIYDDTYDDNNPDNSRVILMPEKILGFSMAYCDNDDLDENPIERDNFFGSVEVPEDQFNSHWENADGFGLMKLIDTTGYVAIDENNNIKTPNSYRLYQNYPNPFNPSTQISYQIGTNVNVNLSVFDIRGKKVVELVNENKVAGHYEVNWNAAELSSGIYFYRLKAGKFSSVKRCLLVK